MRELKIGYLVRNEENTYFNLEGKDEEPMQ
jgi:hypothetical protein